jgi:putative ABC transport system permease protein
MHDLIQDLRLAVRTLAQHRGFTFVALAILAIGIGANTAIFSFVNGVLLKPLPYAESERIVRVLTRTPDGGRNATSTLNYLDWVAGSSSFEYTAALRGESATLTGHGEAVELGGLRVSWAYFKVFGVQPVLGRTFAPGEDEPGHDQVVILNQDMWQSRFGGDPDILGRSLILDDVAHTVIGVMPGGRTFDGDFWRPLAFSTENRTRDFFWLVAYARLKPGVTLEQAQAEMDTIAARLAAEHPHPNKGSGIALDRFEEVLVNGSLRRSLFVLMGAVGLVLLIGCANLANLLLARGLAREQEFAVRTSLGATRGRLVRQLMAESLLLSFAGALLGIAVGYASLRVLKTVLPAHVLPLGTDATLDVHVLGFAVALSLLTGALCGLLPAWQSTKPNLTQSLKQGGGGASAAHVRHRLRRALVITEVALAYVLLAGAGLLIRSFVQLQQVDPGVTTSNVLTAWLPIASHRFEGADSFVSYANRLTDEIAAVPGIEAVALTSALPLRGWGWGLPFRVADRPAVEPADRPVGFFKMVSPDYFSAVSLRLQRGRWLNERDRRGAARVVVINQTLADRVFPAGDAIGKQLMVEEIIFGQARLGPEAAWEIVGVVADEKVSGLDSTSPSAGMYAAFEQSPQQYQSLVVRTGIEPLAVERSIRHAITRVNPDQPLSDVKTLDRIKRESSGSKRLHAQLLGVFAGLALLLAAIGIYGVISYSVTQRTREIGIRSALGATASNILKLILRQGLVMIVTGLMIGIGAALALTRLIESLLFGIGGRDLLTLTITAGVLAVVGVCACLWPARRAARIDPIIALRGP